MEKGNNNNKTAAAVVWSHHQGRDNPLPCKQEHWAYWSVKECAKRPIGILARVVSEQVAGKTVWSVWVHSDGNGGGWLCGKDGRISEFKTLRGAKRAAERNCGLIARVQRAELAAGRLQAPAVSDNIAAHSKEAREKRAAAVAKSAKAVALDSDGVRDLIDVHRRRVSPPPFSAVNSRERWELEYRVEFQQGGRWHMGEIFRVSNWTARPFEFAERMAINAAKKHGCDVWLSAVDIAGWSGEGAVRYGESYWAGAYSPKLAVAGAGK